MDTQQRFEQYFTKTDSCWEWTGSLDLGGYGKFWMNRRNIASHRAAFLLYRGEIPDGKFVLHTCDNPKCVNPDHLVLGTHRDNVRHMQERGRTQVGEANRSSKLTDEQVRCIIRKVLNGAAVRTTAKEIGCSRNAVKAIANKITWKHIWREFETA